MNFNKFFALAKESGLEVCEVSQGKSSKLDITVFKKELINYSISESGKIFARGIYNGKMGSVGTEKDDKTTPEYIINSIKEGASLIESDDEAIIFEGSPRYKKKNVYLPKLNEWQIDDIIKLLFEIEEKLYAKDPRVGDVEVGISRINSESVLANSHGLKLRNKQNYFYIAAECVVRDGDQVKTSFELFLDNDPDKLNVDEFVDKTVQKALSKLNGVSIKPGSYKAVLSRDVVSSFLNALLTNVSSEDVQKHSSVFEGKLNTQVLSKKITVEEKPLANNIYYCYFDDEGVATKNKVIIKNGVLKTYLYNLVTAKKDGVETTGNASRHGSKMGISFSNIFLKPGKLTEEQLIEKIGNGVYISGIQGLHAGLDSTSGDFSLQAEGFHIKDGKKGEPLTLITASGNLFKLFNDVINLGNNATISTDATTCPSMAVKNIKISAE